MATCHCGCRGMCRKGYASAGRRIRLLRKCTGSSGSGTGARAMLSVEEAVTKLLAFVGGSVGGAIGWWLGERVGIMTAFIISVFGTAAGVYVGIRIGKDHFE